MIKFPHTQATQGLQIYVVGGAVRDAVLGLAGVADYDWVVVGASPDELISRGFIPVGAEFPVFLHPETKEEYALARTERKVGLGYKGFSFYADPSVTLEQDLLRRDLTINALAQDENGHIIDPFGGLEDIRNGIFKHVSDAFLEDPVRILRLARFAAQFPHFNVHVSTLELCKNMVYAGEVDALVPERVWAELTKGLKRIKPSRMWQVLHECGALNRILPKFELNGFMLEVLDQTSSISQVYQSLQASHEESPCELSEESLHALRYALMSLMQSDVNALSHSLKVGSQCHDYAQLTHKLVKMGAVWASQDAEQILHHLRQWDVLRKPQRFFELLVLVVFIAQCLRTTDECPDTIDPDTVNLDLSLAQRWLAYAHSLNEIDAKAISQAYAGSGERIKQAIQDAQLTLLRERFNLR